MKESPFLAILLVLGVAVLLPGCHGRASARFEGGHGTLEIHLTDTPLDLSGVRSVNVTLSGVIVYLEGEPDSDSSLMMLSGTVGPIALLSHPQTFDLLTLTGGATALLASGEVPSGEYSRIRLEISDATLVYQEGNSASLKIESDKVDVPLHFHVSTDAEIGVVLDFDAAASVQVNDTGSGELILRPVVTPRRIAP